jgi:5-methylcytosine-specific restriction endonuclease McrA
MPDSFIRYQKSLKLIDLYPSIDGYCACGCGKMLVGKQTRWASRECNDKVYEEFSILKGNTSSIRKALFIIDGGFCRNCGVYDENWQADHISPVKNGGGFCDLSNLQTLCPDCHKEKTKAQIESQRSAISSQAAVSALTLCT